MIDIIKFNPAHLKHIELQPDQEVMYSIFDNAEYQQLLLCGEAHTAVYNGSIIVCAGFFPITNYMARAWALVSKDAGRSLLPVSRSISYFLKKSDYVRIDTPVRRGFVNGHRWCDLLGFVNETPDTGMKYYGFDGDTYDLYAYYNKKD